MKLTSTSLRSMWLAVLLLCSAVAYAQTANVSISGSVQASEGGALFKSIVTAVHLPSGTRRNTSTDVSGGFVFSNLLVGGPYIVQVSNVGYRTQTINDVYLVSGKTATFTFTLTRLPGPVAKGRGSKDTDKASAKARPATEPVFTASTAPATSPAPQPTAQPAPITVPAPPVAAPAAATAEVPIAKATRPARAYTPRKPYVAPKGVAPAVKGHYDAASGNYIYETGTPVTLKLAGGGVLSGVGVHSTESQLHRFITDPQVKIDTVDLTTGWMNFDRVFFEPGKATLTKESIGQLRNIATLMRAYPKTRIKLGGYTDSTGTYKVNKLLSEARAQTAWAALVEMGVSPSRLEARGYGPRYAISSNATEEGRAMNRRLSVKVLAK